MNAILDNAQKFYPFLLEKDQDGYTPVEKIQKIFCFRIPYYVGPLNTAHQDKGGHSWSVRKKEGKIYPWNFSEMIDEEESATKFIERMTNKCTYLIGEDVLPNNNVFKKYQRVTGKKVKDYLRINGVISKEQELSGFDQNFKSSLKIIQQLKHPKRIQKNFITFLILRGTKSKQLKRICI